MYIVYFVYVDDVLSYIGHGVNGREAHATSGTSSNYNLNKAHFEMRDVKVEIFAEFKTKAEAAEEEKLQILSRVPPYNIVYTKTDCRNKEGIVYAKIRSKIMCDLKSRLELIMPPSQISFWTDEFDRMLKTFGVKSLVEGVPCVKLLENGVHPPIANCRNNIVSQFFKKEKIGKKMYIRLKDEYKML